eukprot:TRINITY_DN9541_c0_g4_i1.p1 TRINITY_DN9541_c0_g4~~TRINITY_DN9541_c0_g4_i1.p1  ORF type:complete len:272 (-),score=71.75 TRINITY_DN9541_c0_g4_i1:98-913(-)
MKGKTRESSSELGMVNSSLVSAVVKKFIRELFTECIEDITDEYLKYTNSLFVINGVLMPRIVRRLAKETLFGVVAEAVYDDMVKKVLRRQMDFLSQAELEQKHEELESEEKEKAFGEYIDSLIMETCLLKISREYEAEESQLFKAEAQSKKRRDALAEKRRELRQNLNKDETDSKYNYDRGNDFDPRAKSMSNYNPHASSVGDPKVKKPLNAVSMDLRSVHKNSQPDQKESIKDRIAEINKSGKGGQEPKNQLEDALMQLHSCLLNACALS